MPFASIFFSLPSSSSVTASTWVNFSGGLGKPSLYR